MLPMVYQAQESDGKILLCSRNSSGTFNGAAVGSIFRINSSGTLDTSFSQNFGSLNSGYISAVNPQHDNKLVVVGSFNSINSTVRNGFARIGGDQAAT